jgi:hypothetical protein
LDPYDVRGCGCLPKYSLSKLLSSLPYSPDPVLVCRLGLDSTVSKVAAPNHSSVYFRPIIQLTFFSLSTQYTVRSTNFRAERPIYDKLLAIHRATVISKIINLRSDTR